MWIVTIDRCYVTEQRYSSVLSFSRTWSVAVYITSLYWQFPRRNWCHTVPYWLPPGSWSIVFLIWIHELMLNSTLEDLLPIHHHNAIDLYTKWFSSECFICYSFRIHWSREVLPDFCVRFWSLPFLCLNERLPLECWFHIYSVPKFIHHCTCRCSTI